MLHDMSLKLLLATILPRQLSSLRQRLKHSMHSMLRGPDRIFSKVQALRRLILDGAYSQDC